MKTNKLNRSTYLPLGGNLMYLSSLRQYALGQSSRNIVRLAREVSLDAGLVDSGRTPWGRAAIACWARSDTVSTPRQCRLSVCTEVGRRG